MRLVKIYAILVVFFDKYWLYSIMKKIFNTAGACVPEKHYMLTNDFTDLKKLIDNERYFILHAPRQTGFEANVFVEQKLLPRKPH